MSVGKQILIWVVVVETIWFAFNLGYRAGWNAGREKLARTMMEAPCQ